MRRDDGRLKGRPCALCGIAAGNGAGVPVHSYTLLRSAPTDGEGTRTRSYGTLSICDRCLREQQRGALGKTVLGTGGGFR